MQFPPERISDFLVVRVEIWPGGNAKKKEEVVSLVTQNVKAEMKDGEAVTTYIMSVRKGCLEIGLVDIEGHVRGAGALVLAGRALDKLIKR